MINNIIKITFMSIALLFINGCEQKASTQKKETIETTFIETGEISDGALLYNQVMKKHCKISGYSLARKKTKQEWKTLAQNGKLAVVIKEICPTIEYNHNWTPDIYEFLYNNAISNNLTTSYQEGYQASYQ
jgi:hypothetical protein